MPVADDSKQSSAATGPALIPPNRADQSTDPTSALNAILPPVVKDLLRQFSQAANDQTVELRIEAGALAEYARQLQAMSPILAARRAPAGWGLRIKLYHPPEARCDTLDLACLKPLATERNGLHLQALEMEASMATGLPDGFSILLAAGHMLKRLSLTFVDANPMWAPVLEAHLLQCLRQRKHPLDSLELIDFELALCSNRLGALLGKDGFPLKSLALKMRQAGVSLDPDFRIAELIAGSLSDLQLTGLTLSADNMKGMGKRLDETNKLEVLAIESCTLAGQTEEFFCGLVNNRSLLKLVFLQNQVEAKSVPPHRLLRLLLNAPRLQCLRIDRIENDAFDAALTQLCSQKPQLDVQLHSS